MLNKLLRKILSILVRKQLRKISNNYPMSLAELTDYHDFMAIEAIMTNSRVLGVSLESSKYLRELQSIKATKTGRWSGRNDAQKTK